MIQVMGKKIQIHVLRVNKELSSIKEARVSENKKSSLLTLKQKSMDGLNNKSNGIEDLDGVFGDGIKETFHTVQ